MVEMEDKKESLLYDFGIGLYNPETGLDYFTTKENVNLFFREITPYQDSDRLLFRYS